MLAIENLLILLAAYLVPMYVANATPILIHGKKPLDFGKNYKGKRILGDGKTILGTLAGILGGALAGYLLAIIFTYYGLALPNQFSLSVALAAGAILGDLAKSFFKRRLGKKSGERWLFADQLDFVLGGFIVGSLVRLPEIELVIVLLLITVFIHSFTNFVAYKLRLKKVPW